MRLIAGALVLSFSLASAAVAAMLGQETVADFEQYIRGTEARIADQVDRRRSFLWADESNQRLEQLRQGRVIAQLWKGERPERVRDGLIHDWIGAIFVPGATLEATLAVLQNYNNHYRIYQPEVIASRVLEHEGNHYKVHLRVLKKKVLTVVLNTEHDVQYYALDKTRWYSRSYSTRIAEVEDPGQPNERELPVGRNSGYLWRLYSYWRFQERDGGVYVECEAISLTRDIPTGLGWLIEPIIRELPRDSLVNTLEATRRALKQ